MLKWFLHGALQVWALQGQDQPCRSRCSAQSAAVGSCELCFRKWLSSEHQWGAQQPAVSETWGSCHQADTFHLTIRESRLADCYAAILLYTARIAPDSAKILHSLGSADCTTWHRLLCLAPDQITACPLRWSPLWARYQTLHCTARMVEMNRLAGLHNPGQTACTLYTLHRPVSWPHYSRRHITRPLCPRCPDAGPGLSGRACTCLSCHRAESSGAGDGPHCPHCPHWPPGPGPGSSLAGWRGLGSP